MVNSHETKKKGPFDFLEKKIVFQISRIFFWVLCAIAGVAFIVSIVLFLYNAIPPIKKTVAEPALPVEVSISLTEIEKAIVPPPKPKEEKPVEVAKPTEEVKPAEKPKPTPPPPDPLQVALDAQIDTLKSYFPTEKFTWQTIYTKEPTWVDVWGRGRDYITIVKKYGLDRHLNEVLELYDNKQKKIAIVKELTGIIAQIPEENRAKALEAYSLLRTRKEDKRNNEIYRIKREAEQKRFAAESKYRAEQAKKAIGIKNSLRYIGGAFVSIALVGLFLCFLAIERNTRMLQALLDKEK